MRNLTTDELVQANGGCTFANLFGNCPYEAHIVHSAVGATAGALYSYAMLGNATIWQCALGGAAVALALQIGGNAIGFGTNSTAS